MLSEPTGPEWWVAGRSGTLRPWAQSQVFASAMVCTSVGQALVVLYVQVYQASAMVCATLPPEALTR